MSQEDSDTTAVTTVMSVNVQAPSTPRTRSSARKRNVEESVEDEKGAASPKVGPNIINFNQILVIF